METQKNLKELIEESNAAFAQATPAEKRVIIAQDVIDRIRRQNIIPFSGNFFKDQESFTSLNEGKDLKEVFNSEVVSCEVCAKGALFCAIIGRTNDMSVNNFGSISFGIRDTDDEGHQRLNKYFSMKQIDLIETAFEGTSFLDIASKEEHEAAKAFALEHRSWTDLMTAIMENIIENDGEFIP